MTKPTCPHDVAFEVFTRVDRVEHDGGSVTFMLECHARCQGCGVRFRFLGLPRGMMWNRPMTDPSAFELRAPIEPDAHLTSLMAGDPECAWPGSGTK